jgi:hypothetical protein
MGLGLDESIYWILTSRKTKKKTKKLHGLSSQVNYTN